ncbi:glycerophosphodiester phosphodiesterase family protein [Caballeronia sp. LZ062]|uniref:glycerophosphodiester phosphodiesterase family protein n=1 Tax=unclassified Caballeronia TaxID=2646786 RepID=UPI0028664566|nr:MULTISPECIES: glycerophosphodiester phosphodiesterase family protein [unclassified Caballeronia]MDR5857796.1 glycerophosphodiester phosphodiesterase family protein [Caballeronia sp. LZ050]MDR5869346.1 glycerophosphodiester phosphodiesterase family protein [Caballeronia sp. LZ062]
MLTPLRWIACACLAASGVAHAFADDPPALPMIVAHRAGTADFPENTLLAIAGALEHRADAIWLSVQITRDGVPVLYRPADLSANTDGNGAVASLNLNALQRLNAGWNFARLDAFGARSYPYRAHPVRVPTLEEALRAIPARVPVILDMKALPAEPQAAAVARVLDAANAWSRVLIYSTDAAYQTAFAAYPQARLFESRDATRERLAAVALGQRCAEPPQPRTWAAFEWKRQMELVETFTLGEARSPVTAKLWTPAALACFRARGETHVLAIGIDNAEDYRAAACLGIDAVLADSPRNMQAIKASIAQPLQCTADAR